MYLVPEVRGMGLGKKMIETCFDNAREMGYKNIYLETMPELEKAVKVYEKLGFEYLPGPLGNSGHFGCGKWMLKAIV
ncbi:MAG: GNAT family N-acetyltransferase [Chitinophagaceae bacterium]|nr:GNAT family N-acetyltransferase [Chitinophagaceae bacterium]